MATENRRTDPPLDEELFADAFRFGFFQAVRLLERIEPDRKPVGRDAPASQEVVRFRTLQTLSFPASEIYEITRDAEELLEKQPEMTVSFMGLTGPLGVLPHHYTELIMDRVRYKDTALWAFLDLFNHRMLSLFYRIWEKHRFPIAYERGELDRFTSYLFDIVGMGTGGLRGRSSFEDQGLIYYGGLVAQRPHSASATAAIITDYFAVPARVVQFSGQWLMLDDNITRLGSAFSNLGVNTIAGSRVWDSQSKFRIQLGPLTLREFQTFVPDGSAFRPISELLRLFVGLEFDFDIQLVLKAEEVPSCYLGSTVVNGAKLGWTSWLKTRGCTANDEQVVLAIK